MSESKPAIFAFTTAYHPFIGGAEITIAEVARRLGGTFRFFIITARFRKDLAGREERLEGTVLRVGLGCALDKWLLLFLGPLAALLEFRRLGVLRPLLWGMDVSAGSAAAALLKCIRPRLPFVLSVQYGYGGERLRYGRMGLIGLGYRFMLGRADRVSAISSFLAGTARRFGCRQEVSVIPNGVAIERFGAKGKGRIDPMRPVIITASRLVFKNGVDTLIRAIAEVRKSVPDVRCHILGNGPERFTLEALARSLELGKHVKFFGNVPNAEVPQYLADAGIFVRPARSEGMGNAFVEALAAGLPIIGTPVEGILDIIADGKTGLFARVDDPADVAAKMLRLIRDPELARSIAVNGRAMAEERFSWHKIAADYGRIFNAELAPAILIAAPQFPPDIGGPAIYAENLAKHFSEKGHSISVLCYGIAGQHRAPGNITIHTVSPLIPSWMKHFVYLLEAFRMLARSDAALVLDSFIVGMPVAIAAWLRRKPILFRLEGDFLWEMYVERTKHEFTLREFYEKISLFQLNLKEKIIYLLSKFAFFSFLRPDYITFSSLWRKAIFEQRYLLTSEQAILISSPWPKAERGRPKREQVLLFAGRFIRIKNIPRLIRAFLRAAPSGWRLELIGEGPERPALEAMIGQAGALDRIRILPPLPRRELMSKIVQARAFVLPSLSDVSPNVILDCLAAGTPFILTKESGFYETLKDVGVFVDPQNEQDIQEKLRLLLDPKFYAAYRKRLENFKSAHSWSEVADEWLKLISALV